MADRYRQISNASQEVRFSRAMFGEAERSRMIAHPHLLTTFNAGDIVPIYCREVLPEEELSIDIDFVIRQTTLLTPTMGSMKVDFYAFWVPNRIVNQSWKAVMGENYSGSWTANKVSLAPLKVDTTGSTQIPVGSVADYYDFPTQMPIPNSVLSQCHDLKFRGYVLIWNEHFRDQNYQPPIPMSTLNVYQGFLDNADSDVYLDGSDTVNVNADTIPDGSFPGGSVAHAIFGSGKTTPGIGFTIGPADKFRRFRAFNKPLKANKLHDYFTSCLPSPQKSQGSIFAPVTGNLPSVSVLPSETEVGELAPRYPLKWRFVGSGDGLSTTTYRNLCVRSDGTALDESSTASGSPLVMVMPTNLRTQALSGIDGLAIDISDIRMASAIQQVYEVMARGGSRYRSIVATFFGVDVDDPFVDIPACLGHVSRELDLFQTAQTSPSESGSTPQGNLAGFGYTNSNGHLFSQRFVEHGYVHIFAIVRHRNIYSTYMPKDNFRLNMLDFYFPQLANISEQPVRRYELNPFAPDADTGSIGYQEAWAEYRFEPDRVTGNMRPTADSAQGMAVWNYADDFDSNLQIVDSNFLVSNSEEVLNRTVAVTSSVAPQFKGSFRFTVDKTLPMPTYSVPGMDII